MSEESKEPKTSSARTGKAPALEIFLDRGTASLVGLVAARHYFIREKNEPS